MSGNRHTNVSILSTTIDGNKDWSVKEAICIQTLILGQGNLEVLSVD
jgi:hypothetical protein